MDNFLVKDSDYVNNIHFISNSNEVFIDKSKKLLNDYDDKQKQFIFYHYIPDVDNNQYISNVRLIDNNNGLFYYEITIGNMFEEKSNFYLSAYKNSYNYDSSLILNQKIPLFNKQINLSPNSELRDTISIKLKPEYFSEILFKLEKIETIEHKFLFGDTESQINLEKEVSEQRVFNQKQKQRIEEKSVHVKSIDMPFGEMVVFIFKWTMASLPTALFLAILFLLFTAS